MDYTTKIKEYLSLEYTVLQSLDINAISEAMNALDSARKRNAIIYIMGNGGSASTASHFLGDFSRGLSEHLDVPFRFSCLSDNTATVMAIANDIGYDRIFSKQLAGRVTANDIVIGISGSGNSANIINAIEVAKDAGAKTIGLTGFDGGKLAKMVDILLHVPVMSMQVTEDIHMIFNHLMMAVFYQELCGIDHVK